RRGPGIRFRAPGQGDGQRCGRDGGHGESAKDRYCPLIRFVEQDIMACPYRITDGGAGPSRVGPARMPVISAVQATPLVTLSAGLSAIAVPRRLDTITAATMIARAT